jgi:hypothetical protein
VDALRYSQVFPGGTARTVALGGAFGALGGDFYSASQNPAGLGVYRRSELVFTPELYNTSVDATYNGQKNNDFENNFGFSNIGYVAAFKPKEEGIVGGSFAIGYNKINNYSNNIHIRGRNTQTTLADDFVSSANYGVGNGPVDPVDLLPFTEGLFYDGFIMDIDNDGYYYVNEEIRDADGNIDIDQDNTLDRSGKLNEWVFALGLNYEHKLYFGATFSIISAVIINAPSFVNRIHLWATSFFDMKKTWMLKVQGIRGSLD